VGIAQWCVLTLSGQLSLVWTQTFLQPVQRRPRLDITQFSVHAKRDKSSLFYSIRSVGRYKFDTVQAWDA